MATTNMLTPANIDRNSPVPLYSQLKDALLMFIETGEFQEGDPIPTERELGEQFQVSRITVRRAIAELSRTGYLTTHQGKGTFVATPKIDRPMSQLKSFSSAIIDEGHQPGSRLLSLHHERAAGKVASFLGIGEETWIWRIERLRLADDEPIGISSVYLNLPPDIVLTPAELEREVSLWSILDRKGIDLAESEETIQSMAASEAQAELLQVEPGFPLLLVEGVVYSSRKMPVEYHCIFNRGDRYKYSIRVVRHSV
jgi:GntR family transcriptional regulator